MRPNDPIAQRFPLIARPRPACPPVHERIHALLDRARTAAKENDPSRASAVYNQSALLASDLGLPTLARDLCHRHADAYLHACPLTGPSAIRALEPVVNLARLHIRARNGDIARQHLLALYEAVSMGTDVQLGRVTVPARLTATAEDRHEVRTWLWTVLVADGTRALTTQGRWNDALTHIQKHRGMGKRMLDGRQVAVLAALTADDPVHATALLHATTPGEPWEQAVTACLTALCRRAAQQTADLDVENLVGMYGGLEPEPGTAIFNIRLGLTILDVIGADIATARHIANELHHRATKQNDGYAALENLRHPLFNALASAEQQGECREILGACSLGAGRLPDELRKLLMAAVSTSDRTIRRTVHVRPTLPPL
ncbi:MULTISPECIES: hypothetical protein [Streptomyces]|uniref:Uncharacterized protein n=1 Tax=Streptomyces tsukubensis (strain DSM 42081 / NBRC 108919 / NRRL 18488 / 9993) TaxID=1114943 RepID=I2N878_STRT9|nr:MULTISPECIES: hypothetical protein [Streptomyces]AZK97091.1 hypothetical protein B7R87_26905 [Streptomyces tsukubensis]EIF93225.1 hypothetical protein [Streptomyces tsukubensis NRRL18488]MYS67974.1 hypothetical protein [Streptomyces sp. SID5473]QKM66938.1 hypothetical protein STSU_006865 [Streptomyces tsukubensis NRRL18488]TAI44715.1 hypothetical protein EWI31_05375 [Streptomyces tsukubensis]